MYCTVYCTPYRTYSTVQFSTHIPPAAGFKSTGIRVAAHLNVCCDAEAKGEHMVVKTVQIVRRQTRPVRRHLQAVREETMLHAEAHFIV